MWSPGYNWTWCKKPQKTVLICNLSALNNLEILSVSYVLQGSKWKVKAIRYSISKYPTTRRLSQHVVNLEVKKAFSFWENVTDLSFHQTNYVDSHMDIR